MELEPIPPETVEHILKGRKLTRKLGGIVLEMLDEISQPLDRRELEKAMGRLGINRSVRKQVMPALMELQPIGLLPRNVG